MESLNLKLRRVISESFPDAKVKIDRSKPADKFGGLVVWKGFEGADQVARQERLWKILRDQLSRDEQLKITAILTMTPAER
jgi:acid stress-induced BolA-like protein IbaG/YrbA